jgi:hypothetical protein
MSRTPEPDRIARRSRADDEVWHRLAVLEQEIEEHRSWLREEPLLRRRHTKAA